MKLSLTILLLCSLFYTGQSQTYVQGATDASGDPTQPSSPDTKAIYHAMNITADSLWFKIEFYRRVDNVSWNVKIGIDTNNNATDGGSWAGTNTSLKYDLMADVYNNPGFPPPFGNILTGNGAFISNKVRISFPDTNVLVLGLRLSEIKQAGTPLRYIAGTGLVLGLVNDDIPNTGFVTVSGSTGIKNQPTDASVLIYPNPGLEELHFTLLNYASGSDLQFSITDSEGKQLMAGTLHSASPSINISSLKARPYFLHISDGRFHAIQPFIKQ